MREAVHLIEQLEDIQESLREEVSDNSDSWQHKYAQACQMKVKHSYFWSM